MREDNVRAANVLYLQGRRDEAAELYAALAADGDREAAMNYATCLLFGEGVARDEKMAKRYFGYAVGGLGGDASYNLAVMYLHGVGVARDYKKTYSYMYDAAREGCIEAQLYLGIAHTLGSLFEPDIIAVTRIPYHAPIYRNDGNLLCGEVADAERDEELRRAAVRLDPRSAFEWFRIAARHDPTYAEELTQKGKFLYARCFLDGLGTEFNRRRAEELMLIAARDGSQEAIAYIETEAPYLLEALGNDTLIGTIRGREGILPPA